MTERRRVSSTNDQRQSTHNKPIMHNDGVAASDHNNDEDDRYVRSASVILHHKRFPRPLPSYKRRASSSESDDMFTMFRWSHSCLSTTTKEPRTTMDDETTVATFSSLPLTLEYGNNRRRREEPEQMTRTTQHYKEETGQIRERRRAISRRLSCEDDDMFTMFDWASSPTVVGRRRHQTSIRHTTPKLSREQTHHHHQHHHQHARKDGTIARAA